MSNTKAATRFRVSRNEVALGLTLVALVLAVYLPAMSAGYVWDDDDYVENNPTLRSADGLRQIWFEIGATPQYYPMVHTSYWLEYRLWQTQPEGYHVVNILLHGLGALLLWRVLYALQVPGAWVAAAIFAVHPVHVESVAWVTERKNVLSGVFYFAAALAYLRFSRCERESERAGRWYVAALLLFAGALLSKTVTASLPAALLLVVWWKRGRITRENVRPLLPFFGLGVVLGGVTVWMEKFHVGAAGEEWGSSLVERGLLAGRIVWFYAAKLAWPSTLTFVYPRWEIDATVAWQYLFPLGALAVVVALWLGRRRLGRGPLVAVLFFAGTLFPALGFVDVFPMRYSFVADHFQYLASVGLIALAVAGVATALARAGTGRAVGVSLAAIVIAALGALSYSQSRVYADIETLWRDTLRKNPEAWIAHNNLGTWLGAHERHDEAIEHYRLTLELKPDHPEAEYNWANALVALDRLEEAIPHYHAALGHRPDYAKAHFNLATALVDLQRIDEAIPHYRAGLSVKPQLPEMHFRLAVALRANGQSDEALEPLAEAIRLSPEWPEPINALAWILATHPDPDVRRPDRALALAEQASRLTGNRSARVLQTLAAAYAAAGEFDHAVQAADAALALAQRDGNRALAQRVGAQRERYRQSTPYLEQTRHSR